MTTIAPRRSSQSIAEVAITWSLYVVGYLAFLALALGLV